jgi:hypothetical protein
MEYSNFGERDIGRICIGRPTKKGTEMTISQSPDKVKEWSKGIKELKCLSLF